MTDDYEKTVVDYLTEDGQPIPETDEPEPNPYIDRLFRSWGGKPETVNNWQAIGLSFLEVIVWAATPFVVTKNSRMSEKRQDDG